MRWLLHAFITAIVGVSILCSGPANSERNAAHYAPGVMERVKRID
jgi:hypothetical protein